MRPIRRNEANVEVEHSSRGGASTSQIWHGDVHRESVTAHSDRRYGDGPSTVPQCLFKD